MRVIYYTVNTLLNNYHPDVDVIYTMLSNMRVPVEQTHQTVIAEVKLEHQAKISMEADEWGLSDNLLGYEIK